MRTNWLKLIPMLMTLATWDTHASLTTVVAWGDNTHGQTNVPSGLTNIVMVAQGALHGLAVNGDSTVTAWGNNYVFTTPPTYEGQATPPAGLSNVVSIDAGYYSSIALKNDGSVVFWGDVNETNLPSGLSNVVAIAATGNHSLVLRNDGVLIGWGDNFLGASTIPPGLTNVAAIGLGVYNGMAIKSNGTLTVWGYNGYGQTNVPATATNIVAAAGGLYHILTLRGDGTVVAWGNNSYGQITVPTGLTNVIAIAAGDNHNLALKKNGTVVAWGNNNVGQATVPPGLSNVVAISSSGNQSMVLGNDGSPWILNQPLSQTNFTGMNVTFYVSAIGQTNLSYQWQFDGTNINWATNPLLTLTNVQTTNAGIYSVVVSNSIGSTLSYGATLSVLTSAPITVTSPTDQFVALHSNILISVAATGSLPLFYQWQLNGTNVARGTNALLNITNSQFTNGGNYAVVITNAYGSVTSSIATLTIIDLGMALNATNLTWATTDSYPWCPVVGLSHDGTAVAQSATPPYPQYSELATTVTGPGTLTFWAQSAQFGDYFVFATGLINTNRPQIIYLATFLPQWQQTTVYIGTGTQFLDWEFQTSPFGSGTSHVAWLDQVSFVAGGTPPISVSITTNQTLLSGANVNLGVSALGTPPFTYQWRFNASNLVGATNATLVLTNLLPVNSGIYSVSVTNNYGAACTNVSLLVLPFAVNPDPAKLLMTTNGFQLQLDNVYASKSLIISASTDLLNWLPIYTNAPITGAVQFVDTTATNIPQRFYRATEQ